MHNFDLTQPVYLPATGTASRPISSEYEEQEYHNEQEESFSEYETNELAGELLEISNEDELNNFMNKLVDRATSYKRRDPELRKSLSTLLSGFALSTFNLGNGPHRLNQESEADREILRNEIFELEAGSSVNPEFEAASSFIKMAGNAAQRAWNFSKNQGSKNRARQALRGAAQRYARGLFRCRLARKQMSQQIGQRIDSLEKAVNQLAELINDLQQDNAGSQNTNTNQGNSATDNKHDDDDNNSAAGDENELEYDYESEDNEFEEEEYEENEYEENEEEYEDNEIAYEDEFMSEYEENEYEENEFEENEYEEHESEENEYEDNEFEENEYEDNEFEENEYEDSESESYAVNEYESNSGGCGCAKCKQQNGEFEDNEMMEEDPEGTFSEAMQTELASELLSVQTEEELDMFLGKLLKKAGRLAKNFAKGKIILPGPLKGVLKSLAKKVLPVAGNIIGGAFVPGLGNTLGQKLGKSAAGLFELESEGMSSEDLEFETAKAFVRLAGNAGKRASMMRRSLSPKARTRLAMRHAARRYAPRMLRRRRYRKPVNRRKPMKRHHAHPKRHLHHHRPHHQHSPQQQKQAINRPLNQNAQSHAGNAGNDEGLNYQQTEKIFERMQILERRISQLTTAMRRRKNQQEPDQKPDEGNDHPSDNDSEYWG